LLILPPLVLSRAFASQTLTRALLEGTVSTPHARRRMEIAGGIAGLLSEAGLLGAGTGEPPPPAGRQSAAH